MTPGRRQTVALWAALAAALLGSAWLLINTTFMFYDDEGYMLHGLRAYFDGGRLYDGIFSQYGPWPFVYQDAIARVMGSPITHMAGRGLTALHWVAASLFCGAIARRLGGGTATAVAATFTTFGLLWQMDSEPSHPGSMISVLVAAAAWLTAGLPTSAKPQRAAAALGVLSALLLLTKINVGLLLAAGLGGAALLHTSWPTRLQRPAAMAAAAGLLTLPWVLMAKKLGDPWVDIFAVQFTLSAAGLLWVTPAAWTHQRLPGALWLTAAVATAVTAAVVCGAVMLHGTSAVALWHAVLLGPLRHPASFMIGFTWLPAVWPVTVVCLLVTAWAGWEMRRNRTVSSALRRIVIVLRLAVLVAFATQTTTWLTIHGVGRFIVFCLPLLPLFLMPLSGSASGARIPAPWLAAFVALPQVLHAYPVAGSQMGWGTFLLVPIFITGLHDALRVIQAGDTRSGLWAARAGWAVLFAVNLTQLALLAGNGWERHHTSRPLGLPGADGIRLEGPARLALRTLVLNASVHADVLFSRPGMFSYNLWSGVPTPTGQNATHWFWLLDAPAQNDIVGKLQTEHRSAVIASKPLEEFLRKINVPMTGPLLAYIEKSYKPLLETEGLVFLVPQASAAVPFGKVEMLAPADGTAQPGGETLLLRTNIVLDGLPASFRLEHSNHPWETIRELAPPQSRIILEPINSEGRNLGGTAPLPANGALRGLFRLTVITSPFTPPRDAVLVVADPEGRVLAESVF